MKNVSEKRKKIQKLDYLCLRHKNISEGILNISRILALLPSESYRDIPSWYIPEIKKVINGLMKDLAMAQKYGEKMERGLRRRQEAMIIAGVEDVYKTAKKEAYTTPFIGEKDTLPMIK